MVSLRGDWRPAHRDASRAVAGRKVCCSPTRIQQGPLTLGDSHLICATESAVLIYSTADSLLEHAFRTQPRDSVCAFTLCSVDSKCVYAGTQTGYIYQWDFTTGDLKGRWRSPSAVYGMETAGRDGANELYVLRGGKTWDVSIHRLGPGGVNEAITVMRHKSPIRSFKVCEGGDFIFGITLSSFLIGRRVKSDGTLTNTTYTWREFKCSEGPTCFDVKIQTSGTNSLPTVDLAIGGVRGAIFVYADVLRRVAQMEKPPKQSEGPTSLTAQQLHWHRQAVETVAWSLDGNYLISGGTETTLVLWQLETGRKQFLPHLASPILSLTLSPTGSSYVVRLGDNSVMVLSTSELSPTAHVAGVQSASLSRVVRPMPILQTVDLYSQFSDGAPPTTVPAAATINPRAASHLLLSVPAHQIRFAGSLSPPTPYLQDFDLSSARSVSRQAMTRTNATNVNQGPEKTAIQEPSVKYLQVSRDGQWLATVDEWTFPPMDARLEDSGEELHSASNSTRRESRLSFWVWNPSDDNWMLNTRIDEPHRYEDQPGCVPVIGLAADPAAAKFATIGADAVVKLWAPKTKLKSGKIVRSGGGGGAGKGASTEGNETWWSLEITVPLDRSVSLDRLQSAAPDRAILAYSNDGSVLAAYTHHDTFDTPSPIVHFIDAANGSLRESRHGLYDGHDGIHGLAFLDRYLICLGRNAAVVWDVTSFDLCTFIPIKTPKHKHLSQERNAIDDYMEPDSNASIPVPVPHLAVNLKTHTFAVASAAIAKDAMRMSVHPLLKFKTRVQVFSPDRGAEPVFRTKIPRATVALLSKGGSAGISFEDETPAVEKKGYVLLDVGAEIHTLAVERGPIGTHADPNGISSPEPPRELSDAQEEGISAEDDDDAIEEGDAPVGAATVPRFPLTIAATEDTRPVVRPEKLAEVFDYPSHAMPPMKDLFQGVMRLYAKKPAEAEKAPLTELANLPPPQREQTEHEEEDDEDEESDDDDSDSDS